MIISMFNMPFHKKVMLKIWTSALFIILGGVAIVINPGSVEAHGESFRNGLYFGLGTGLIVAGAVNIIKCVQLLRNAEKFRVAEISDSDERRRFIFAQSFIWTIFFMRVLIFVAIVVAGMYSKTVCLTLAATIGVYGIIMRICYTVARKLY